MAHLIQDVMTRNPITMSATDSVADAARAMRDADVGDVIVVDAKQKICGIVTDRDIVVRALAEGHDPARTAIDRVCSHELVTLSPDQSTDEAVKLMREKAIRRIPVVENGQPVGVISLGDLAIERDKESALGQISAAPPNN